MFVLSGERMPLDILLKYVPVFVVEGCKLAISMNVLDADKGVLHKIFKDCGMLSKQGDWYCFEDNPIALLSAYISSSNKEGEELSEGEQLTLF